MKRLGLRGAIGSKLRTTIADAKAPCQLGHVNRVFKAELIYRRGPWKTKEPVGLASLE